MVHAQPSTNTIHNPELHLSSIDLQSSNMKLILIILPLVHAGTNKTIAPTPGFNRPNPPSPTPDDDGVGALFCIVLCNIE